MGLRSKYSVMVHRVLVTVSFVACALIVASFTFFAVEPDIRRVQQPGCRDRGLCAHRAPSRRRRSTDRSSGSWSRPRRTSPTPSNRRSTQAASGRTSCSCWFWAGGLRRGPGLPGAVLGRPDLVARPHCAPGRVRLGRRLSSTCRPSRRSRATVHGRRVDDRQPHTAMTGGIVGRRVVAVYRVAAE